MYPGVPKEMVPKMDRCVKKIMKDGKSQSVAETLCKTSILSQKQKSKEEKAPDRIVEDKETRLVYFSSTPIKEQTLNASKAGKMLKNVEIFKSGTYRNTQFKNSSLDKMVANFHYLKAFGTFPNVPVRADHPSFGFFGGGGDIIDKVGGYVEDLRREGSKLVADIRVTSQQMWDKIAEGTYINRSAEIGTYDDNEGTIYSPVLFGFAWVDIPQVEGLSPRFNYSKDNKNIELINLNAINMEKFPPEEEIIEPSNDIPEDEPETETKPKEGDACKMKDGTMGEMKMKDGKMTCMPNKSNNSKEPMEFEKAFPTEAAELAKLRDEKTAFELEKRTNFVDQLEKSGKILPAQKKAEAEFVKALTEEQFAKYKAVKDASPAIVKLDAEETATEAPKKEEEPVEKTPDEKADDFLKETK